jgi:hypothetical protein
MSNRIQLRRTATPGSVPNLAQLLEGELALNLADNDLYVSTGAVVIHLNSAGAIKTDATHRFLTDNQIAELYAPASVSTSGNVQIGSNINVNASGVISLDVADATHTGVLAAADWTSFNGKQEALGFVPVNKAGDTMLGALVLNGTPTAPNQASTKQYVDDQDALNVKLSGDTMTGLLVLSADPAQNLGAATKQYVDSAVSTVSGSYGAPVQSIADITSLLPAAREDKQMRLVEDTGAIYRYDVQATDAADGDGVLMPADTPVTGRWIKVAAATQNHENLFGLQGGAANDHLHITTVEKNSYDGHLTDTTVHVTPLQSSFINSINASATELNYSIGVTGPIQTQLDGKQEALGFVPVNKAGDTMLGLLTLFADPSLAMHAVTLTYLENFTVDGGTW